MIPIVALCWVVTGTGALNERPMAAKPTTEETKRPTTKEQFAELAKAGPYPPWRPDTKGHVEVIAKHIHGTVVAVAEDAIEIRLKGQAKQVKYPAHELLRSGAVCHYESDSFCYLLDDVRPGDEVVLAVGAVDKHRGEEGFRLTINRRPEGTIPPSRKPDETDPYHKYRQRQVGYEERGEYPPEEIRAHEEKVQFCAERGLPPPPVLPPRVPLVDPKKKKD